MIQFHSKKFNKINLVRYFYKIFFMLINMVSNVKNDVHFDGRYQCAGRYFSAQRILGNTY